MAEEEKAATFEMATLKHKDGQLTIARADMSDRAMVLALWIVMALCLMFLDPATAAVLLALLIRWLAS